MTAINDTKPRRAAPPSSAPAYVAPVSANTDERTVEIVAATSARDRQGDVVEPAGLDFSNYLKNPVVLWAHDLERPPVGKITGVRVTSEAVAATVRFADTEFAAEVFSLYAGGYLSAWSIGFIPRRWERIDPTGREAGYRVLEAEVVEVSAVPVPANPEALTRRLADVQSLQLRDALVNALARDEEEPEPAVPAEVEAPRAGTSPAVFPERPAATPDTEPEEVTEEPELPEAEVDAPETEAESPEPEEFPQEEVIEPEVDDEAESNPDEAETESDPEETETEFDPEELKEGEDSDYEEEYDDESGVERAAGRSRAAKAWRRGEGYAAGMMGKAAGAWGRFSRGQAEIFAGELAALLAETAVSRACARARGALV